MQISKDRHNLVDKEKELIASYDLLMEKLSDYHRQRAKKDWIKDGDRNTSFFQQASIKRRRKNRIASLVCNNDYVTNPDDISQIFIQYFSDLFCTDRTDEHNSYNPIICDSQEVDWQVPDEEEIWQIVKSMRRNASPGPDGLNAAFYRSAWSWIKEDLMALIQDFYRTGNIPSDLNKTNIVLIPKKNRPTLPKDFRPISLCNVPYKIIAKSVANRIKGKLPDLICHSQHAFIPGRRIANNIILAQEIVHSFGLNSSSQHAFLIKIDLSKAFDRLEWDFIATAMQKKGFHHHFINLVLSCIKSSSFSVTINGQAYGSFNASRGIRQGCPLSPYLFVLALNELSDQLNEALQNQNIKGIKLSDSGPAIHSLLYADDLIITGTATVEEATQIKNIIDNFCRKSGQTPNWDKSGILFSKKTPSHIKHAINHIFPVPILDSNARHLGHPLFVTNRNKFIIYRFILEKFKAKLTTLKANKLSHAGRLTLIKSVFSSLPVYYMATILLSRKLLSKITAIIRKFWWTGVKEGQDKNPLCLKSWKDICRPIDEGGLGIRDIQAVNKSLILNSAWRLVTNPQDQIAQILKGKYFPNSSFWDAPNNTSKSVYWSSVLHIRKTLKSSVTWQLGDGNISIWNQPWCDLNEDFFHYIKTNPMPSQLPIKVSDLWTEGKEWDNQKLNALFEEEAIHKILQVPIIQGDAEDKLRWKFTKNGVCNTKSAYKEFYKGENPSTHQVDPHSIALLKTVWKEKNIPPKVKVFAWRLLRGALPSALRLNHRIRDISAACYRCGAPESDFHLFFSCPYSRLTWMMSGHKLDFNSFPETSILALIIALVTNNNSNKIELNKLLIILWQLWKARNDFKFQGIFREPSQICYLADAMASSYACVLSQSVLQEDIQQNSGKRRMDSIPNGIRCYIDGAWGNDVTGIGIFFHFPHSHNAIFIKATSDKAQNPLQAELLALQLSLDISMFLNFAGVVFLMDNATIVDAVKRNNLKEDPGHWSLIPFWSQIIASTPVDMMQVNWIPREMNKMADKLSKEAKSLTRRDLVHNCQNISHVAYPNRDCYARILKDHFKSTNCKVKYILCF